MEKAPLLPKRYNGCHPINYDATVTSAFIKPDYVQGNRKSGNQRSCATSEKTNSRVNNRIKNLLAHPFGKLAELTKREHKSATEVAGHSFTSDESPQAYVASWRKCSVSPEAVQFDKPTAMLTPCDLSRNVCGHYDNPLYNPPLSESASEPVELTSLAWLTFPVRTGIAHQTIAAFAVQANPQCTGCLELVVHQLSSANCVGDITTRIVAARHFDGARFVRLRSQGCEKPSVAVFADIALHIPGQYAIEIRSVRHPDRFSLIYDIPVTIETHKEWTRRMSGSDDADYTSSTTSSASIDAAMTPSISFSKWYCGILGTQGL
ncbi:uncharacterized protein LOC129586728 isoform X2 [Paramacrobiotus metropolitanus]|uniref:uncharacterized protein LOC129586728 isoform X2 n=1 Tax=Paramacrobiotus metropolitanus TaxID=2943436 RepID=UPI0024464614|nr:uncharacterized protein LOC129586728 isoform X2 [Paramacrobiotus metropolitanus]